jgi:hypothetical protein
MPATIRLMSWNMQNYGLKGFNKFDLGEMIAKVLQTYNIDICAMIEISNNGHVQIINSIVVQLNNLGYHQNNWKHTFVNVGDQGVLFLWHEEAPGPNAFRGFRYTNNNGGTIAGKVLRDTTDAMIYFPETKTGWNHLNTQPNGRRAGYCAFETNDGAAVRRFTLLDIHTPFDDEYYIQAYSAKLYSTAREVLRVETTDTIHAITQVKAAAGNYMAAQVNPLVQEAFGRPNPGLANAANDAVHNAISQALNQGKLLAEALAAGADAGVLTFVQWLSKLTTLDDAKRLKLARAAAMAGAMAATYMVASILLPTAPPAAVAGVGAATDAAKDTARASASYIRPFVKDEGKFKSAILSGARAGVQAAIGRFTFPNLPTTGMNAAILAGDFNVNYPDTIVYDANARMLLGGVNANAYTGLMNLVHPNTAVINGKTTRIGPTAFRGQRIYKLITVPQIPIQHTNRTLPNFVDLDVRSLSGQELIGYYKWMEALQNLAQNQSKSWSMIASTYADLINSAFDSSTRINDTDYYKASKYDNFFIRGATHQQAGVIDVISELGSWAADTSGHGRWLQALGHLNTIAQTQLHSENGGNPVYVEYKTQKYIIPYWVTTAVNDAEQAAVFFDHYVSDHLPVFVEVSI